MSGATSLLLAVYGGSFASLAVVSFFALRVDEEFVVAALLIAACLQLAGMWMLSSHSGHWTEPRAPVNRLALRLAPVGLLVGAGCWAREEFLRVPTPAGVTVVGFALRRSGRPRSSSASAPSPG